MIYVSLDIETTGLEWEWCQTLSIGAILDDLSNKKAVINNLPRWECLVRWPRITGDPFALAMNKWILEILAQKQEAYYQLCHNMGERPIPILAPEQVMPAFKQWLLECSLKTVKLNYTGKNFSSFDKNFLDANFDFSQSLMGDGFRMAHRFFDVGSAYFKPGIHEGVPSTDDIIKVCNLGKTINGEVISTMDRHDHLGDAARVIQLIRYYHDLEYEGWFDRKVKRE